MIASDLQCALLALGWFPLHAHQRSGRWLVWTGHRAALGSSMDSAVAALLTRYAAGEA